MSNRVYEDIVLPIIRRILTRDPTFGDLFRGASIRDLRLEKFMLEELNRRLGVNGAVVTDAYGNILEAEYCEKLEEVLKELQERNPEELEALIEEILNLYIKMRITLDPKIQRVIERYIGKKVENPFLKKTKPLPNPYFRKKLEEWR